MRERWKASEDLKAAVEAFIEGKVVEEDESGTKLPFGEYGVTGKPPDYLALHRWGAVVAQRLSDPDRLVLNWGRTVHQGHATYIAKRFGMKPKTIWEVAERVGGGKEKAEVPWPVVIPVKSDTLKSMSPKAEMRRSTTVSAGTALEAVEATEAEATEIEALVPGTTRKLEVLLSREGRLLAREMKLLYPMPVLLIGGTGWGKSVLVRHVAHELGLEYDGVNAHPGMDVGLLVGMWRPMSVNGGGVTVEWSDGVLTAAIREGRAFMMEELTRAPQEAISRVFGLLDNGFRYWNLPEAGVSEILVHEKFWFVSTANPAGKGYSTVRLDKALESRFAAIIELDRPTADEKTIVERIVGATTGERIINFVTSARRNTDTNLPTRDVVLLAELVAKGFDPKRAVALSIAPKYKEHGEGLNTLATGHF